MKSAVRQIITLLAIIAIAMVALAASADAAPAQVCPEEGKVESVVDGDLDDIVLDAGTEVCIFGAAIQVNVTADGESTLRELLGLDKNVSHYTVTSEPEPGEVLISATCDLLTVTNESNDLIAIGHLNVTESFYEIAPGETLSLGGNPGVEWYVYSVTEEEFIEKGTYFTCPTTTTTSTPTTSTTTATTVPPTTTTTEEEVTTTENSTTTTTPEASSTTEQVTESTTTSTSQPSTSTLPYTGPTSLVALALTGLGLLAGGVTLIRRDA